MLSDNAKEEIQDHYNVKIKRCTENSDKLRGNMIRFMRGFSGVSHNDIKETLDKLGLPTTDEEIRRIL
jgi:hypothetical protein